MRWLWQHAMRWAGQRAWQEAKQAAATPEPTPDVGPAELPRERATVALICESKRLFDAVADELTRTRRFEGDRLAVCTGTIAGQPVVVARAMAPTPNYLQLVSAIVDGHRPQFALSAAEATSLQDDVQPGDVVVANRVFNQAGESLRLDGSAPPLKGFHVGGVAPAGIDCSSSIVDEFHQPLCQDAWSEPVARACRQVGLAMMAASVVFEPSPAQRSKEVAALKGQKSRAGQAGALAGMLWKKPSGFRELWNANEASWEGCAKLAALVKQLAAASPAKH